MGRKKRLTKAQMRMKCFETRKRLDAVHHPYFVPKTNNGNGDNKDTSAHPEALPHNSNAPPPPPYDAGAPYCDANNFVPPPPPPPEAGGFPPPFYGSYFPEQYAASYYYGYGNNYYHPEYYNSTNSNNTADHSIDADDIPATITKEEEDNSMAMESLDNRRIIANSVPSTTLEVALAAELDRQTKQNKEMSEELDKLRRMMYSKMKEKQEYEPAAM
jgi:hypothetical protein